MSMETNIGYVLEQERIHFYAHCFDALPYELSDEEIVRVHLSDMSDKVKHLENENALLKQALNDISKRLEAAGI